MNNIASVLFTIYAIAFHAPAIIVLNVTLLAVNLAYLLTKERFGLLIHQHLSATYTAFAIHAIVVTAWTISSSSNSNVELVGILASLGFIFGFLQPDEKQTRIICSLAICVNIAYVVLIGSLSIAIANCVSLVFNIVRIIKMRHAKSADSKSILYC